VPPSLHADPGSARIVNCPVWWDPNKIPPEGLDILAYMQSFLSRERYLENARNGCVIWGPPGTLKTSVSLGLGYSWAQPGPDQPLVMFQEFSSLMVQIRSAWRKDAAETVAKIHERMVKPDLLILDDMGKRAAPEDAETAITIFDERINRGRATLFNTNCLLDTERGREEFTSACDSRTLERLSNLAIDTKRLPNFRRANAA